ncbi:alpha/beta hydrolase [Mycobacterium vicinigordonae]|uniref:Alpha/beta fold hydrolase n=1 Tax=Mycobacterium vicinigordonae TaxID=1719132 RepID=A0A7D6DVL2_9MYCO|nr:alpha/beta fold hydrolase [Mycobacterium vicinigordonae]QLL05807.1 alpha/beta fold hydrolase [Mycobacterium vicinigordonae]
MGTITATSFTSQATRCAAWLSRPPGVGPHPAIVLAHGLGANHTMALSRYQQHFAAAGMATLAFDYRNLGDSDGTPRQRLSLRRHRRDIAAALDFVRELPDVDAGRVALWGTSLGAMHVLRVAAQRPDLAAVVVQCPIVDGPATLRRMDPVALLRIGPAILEDAVRAAFGRERRYVPIVGQPGSVAAVTVAGAQAGWDSTVDPGGSFDNRVAASNVIEIAVTSAKRAARRITAPVLVCISDRETLMDPRHAEDVARRAPRGTARHYDGDHFQIYHPPLLADLLADQTAFLKEHLSVA